MQNFTFKRLLIVSIFLITGLIAGTWFVFAFESDGTHYFIGAGGILVIVVILILSRAYAAGQRQVAEAAEQRGKGSQVGFMVDTFHEVVAKLKEKERELEQLKASAEEKAGSIEAYNENILQSVPSGVISIDNSAEIKSINQAAGDVLDIDPEKAIARKVSDVFKEPLITIMSETMPVSREEYAYITDKNRHIWLGITSSQLRNAAGEKMGLIFIFTDLTDIRALQAQVELKERLSQLGEMSAGISHELRNSMSVIAGYAKLLSKKVDPMLKNTVDSVSTEISNMDRIISELLAFAKPSVLSKEQIDLNMMIQDAVQSAAGGNEKIRVVMDASGPLHVMADEVLIRQALSNLFINAIDAMPDGGKLEVKLARLDEKTHIYVKDTGYGIPDEIKQKIFLPFYTTKETGIGFGLALVQKIIIAHGGSIEVESKEGEGTEFRINLPTED
ncbi:MAG: ATP-binding protein [Nitrospirota bacterium]